jgi:synaptobrevin family protein YKT6
MVKLFAMSVLYKGPNDATLLKAAFELQSFGYFQRKSVQEFMGFVTKTIVERTASAARQSVKEKGINQLVQGYCFSLVILILLS